MKTTRKYFVFLTNNFETNALEVARMYKNHWKAELFSEWIKQTSTSTSLGRESKCGQNSNLGRDVAT